MSLKVLPKKLLVFLFDLSFVPIAWFGAYVLRFESIPQEHYIQAQKLLPYILLSQALSYYFIKTYRTMWGFSSIIDVFKILKSVLLSLGLFLGMLHLSASIISTPLPRTIIPMYSVLLIGFTSGARLIWRFTKERNKLNKKHHKKTLIIGAGAAGESLVRDMLRSNHSSYKPVAFLDDAKSKRKQTIHGIPVLGSTQDLNKIVNKYNIELIILAIPSASSSNIRNIMQIAKDISIPVYTLPGLSHIVEGRVSIDSLREVSLEDLLGRDQVKIDWSLLSELISDSRILVTGAGGSIGSELCRQILNLAPKEIIVVDNGEFNLFNLTQEIKQKYPNAIVKAYLLDIKDKIALDKLFLNNKIDLIFHAAAYKHVPMLQNQIRAAMTNNVIGTFNLSKLAIKHKVKQFVLVSTDKAVNPENIMGASKRVAEIICQSGNFSDTKFTTVRFGNVLGSAGSVIPTFKKQLEQGGPITVTHPDITRFFMTIPEASQLILHSISLTNTGEIFVLDMGEPIKIVDLAKQMIKLAGKTLDKDISIKFTGLRPGEKLYEELFHFEENLEKTSHKKIMRAKPRNYSYEEIENIIYKIEEACLKYSENKLYELLYLLVPEMAKDNYIVDK